MSHDRYFLNRVCNGILAFEGDGKLHFSEGDYDYYIEKRSVREGAAAVNTAVDQKKQKPQVKVQTNKLKWKEAKELETIEQSILHAEAEIERIEKIFASPDFYEKHGNQTVSLTAELSAAKTTVDRLYMRWHELEELQS